MRETQSIDLFGNDRVTFHTLSSSQWLAWFTLFKGKKRKKDQPYNRSGNDCAYEKEELERRINTYSSVQPKLRKLKRG